MKKVSEWKAHNLTYNHVIYDSVSERFLAKHSHAMVEMIYIIRGEVAYTIEDKKFVARAGDLIIIKPYSYHYFSILKKQDYEKIGMLFFPTEQPIEALTNDAFLLLQCGSGRIHDIFQKIDFYFHNCPRDAFEELFFALAKEVLVNVQLFHQQQTVTLHNPIHPLIERALAYINDNLFSLSTIKELADALSVSEGYLKSLFTQQMKITPKKYITEKRLLMARTMITAGAPPTQTAFQCGYANYVTFYRLYLKTFSVKPTDDYKNTPEESL